jgi:GAF domain-containing protein
VATKHLVRLEPDVDITVYHQTASGAFVPKSSDDSALTAFAQLGALRLNTSYALISLIDTTHQYVLAEATKSLSSQSDKRHDLDDGLWIGSVVLPRELGICQVVLTGDTIQPAIHSEEEPEKTITTKELVIIPDLQYDSRFCMCTYVKGGPQMRFYAGAPLRSDDGTKIGAFAVFDQVGLLECSPAPR